MGLRRLLLLSVVLALLVLWAWLVLRSKQQPLGRPTKENLEKVREGMTMEEVAAILGPPDVNSKRKASPFWQVWVRDGYAITVGYSDSGKPRVASKKYAELPPESFRERLRRWFP
jgi:hypothetical protein